MDKCLKEKTDKCQINLDDLGWPAHCMEIIDSQTQAFYAFTQFDCNNENIDLGFAELKREQLGIMVAVWDLAVMSSFLIALVLWKHWVERDS